MVAFKVCSDYFNTIYQVLPEYRLLNNKVRNLEPLKIKTIEMMMRMKRKFTLLMIIQGRIMCRYI